MAKLSELPPIDQYELAKSFGQFNGTFREFLNSRPALQSNPVPQINQLTPNEVNDEFSKLSGRRNNSLLDMFTSIPLSGENQQAAPVDNRVSTPNVASLTNYIPSMNSLSGLIPTEIPNVFGQRNPLYENLLGVPQSQALSKQSNIAGLLGAAAALASGMGRQGGRRSAAQNILGALGAGYGAAGQQYQQGLQNYGLQQQILNQQLQREKTLRDLQREQAAIGSIDELIKADPSIDPAMKAYLLNNKDKALQMYMQRQSLQKFMAGRQAPAATAPSAEMVAYNEQMAPYTTSGGDTRVIPQAAPVREPTGKLAPGTVETAPVPQPYTGEFGALPTAPKAAPPVNPLEAQIRNADLMAEYFQSQVGIDPDAGVKVKQQQEIAKDLRGQFRTDSLINQIASQSDKVYPTLKKRMDSLISRSKTMTEEKINAEYNNIMQEDAKILENMDPTILAFEIQRREAMAPKINLPSESERTAGYLTTRLKNSLEQYQTAIGETPKAAMPNMVGEIIKGVTRSDYLKNLATPEARQRVEAAQLDILSAALTLSTGAAYTQLELESQRKTYFPELGDKPGTIKDKAVRLDKLLREAATTKAGRAAPKNTSEPSFDLNEITKELERRRGK